MAPGPGHFPRQICAKVPPKSFTGAAASDTLGAAPPPFRLSWGPGAGRHNSRAPPGSGSFQVPVGLCLREPGNSLSCRGGGQWAGAAPYRAQAFPSAAGGGGGSLPSGSPGHRPRPPPAPAARRRRPPLPPRAPRPPSQRAAGGS